MSEVERLTGLGPDDAERAVRAVLETLAERISRGEAEDIAAFLPSELRPVLTSAPEPAEPFSIGEFVRRVAEREGIEKSVAQDHARAVFVALGAAVAPGELRDMAAQLPKDFEPFLEAAGVGRERELAAGLFIRRIAELAGVDEERARRAAEAVLEALAVRISDGQVEDIMGHLPADLIPALLRGLAESRPAKSMSADEFIARVAEREGVSVGEAREHTRAVFSSLRRVLSAKEFSDIVSQLSADYEPLVAAAP